MAQNTADGLVKQFEDKFAEAGVIGNPWITGNSFGDDSFSVFISAQNPVTLKRSDLGQAMSEFVSPNILYFCYPQRQDTS